MNVVTDKMKKFVLHRQIVVETSFCQFVGLEIRFYMVTTKSKANKRKPDKLAQAVKLLK
jgi:hypothetical protein